MDPLVKPEDDSDLLILSFVILAYAGIQQFRNFFFGVITKPYHKKRLTEVSLFLLAKISKHFLLHQPSVNHRKC